MEIQFLVISNTPLLSPRDSRFEQDSSQQCDPVLLTFLPSFVQLSAIQYELRKDIAMEGRQYFFAQEFYCAPWLSLSTSNKRTRLYLPIIKPWLSFIAPWPAVQKSTLFCSYIPVKQMFVHLTSALVLLLVLTLLTDWLSLEKGHYVVDQREVTFYCFSFLQNWLAFTSVLGIVHCRHLPFICGSVYTWHANK